VRVSGDPHGELALCLLADLPDGQARGFLPRDGQDRVFAVRQGDAVHAYVNNCPHENIGLEYLKDRFLSPDGTEIICYGHGAHFDIATGLCTWGACQGQALEKLPARVEDGRVIVRWGQ
jgi:nitrite reductase/ring-hydroxylating ferredoxin subunit